MIQFLDVWDDSVFHKPERISTEGPSIQKEGVKGPVKKETVSHKERYIPKV